MFPFQFPDVPRVDKEQVSCTTEVLAIAGRPAVLTITEMTVSTHQNHLLLVLALGLVFNTYSSIFNFVGSCRMMSVSKSISSWDWTPSL